MTPRPRNEIFAIVLSPKRFFAILPQARGASFDSGLSTTHNACAFIQCPVSAQFLPPQEACRRCRQPEDEVQKMEKADDNRQKALAAALAQIEKQYGKGSIMKMDSEAIKDIDVFSTGSLGLDLALGVGGLPRGRVVEIYGPESSGKTTLTLQVIAEAQKAGRSEERRVGKECRSRWSAYQYKKRSYI